MIKSTLLTAFILSWQLIVAKDEPKYPVSAIPAELKENVNVVVREEVTRFRILSKNSANLYVHQVLTIFNEKGNRFAKEIIGYDKLTKIVEMNAYAYDANGKQIKRLKKSEIYDQAVFDGMTLFSDDRLKRLDLTQATYPYTVEFEYEIEFKFLYYIPSAAWGGENISHEQASYQLIYPKELKPRYQLLNSTIEPRKESLTDGNESLTWNFKNLKPNKFEPSGPSQDEIIPRLLVAPSSFEFSGYPGKMDTWNDYGKWQKSLNKDRDQLPEQTKQKIKEITRNLTTTEQKAKAVYEFMQSKTRYVGIQLGIGGWQPFPASVVDETGYGDCKALSNYTVALLNEAGIKAHYTIIRAGRGESSIKSDFPSNQFNHVVVSVPNGKDTLWLECTSQTNPFGYQGTFTEDRLAFMIDDEGGRLIRTINYTPEQNTQSRTAEVTLEASGNAKAKVTTTYRGIQYESGGLNRTMNNGDEQKKWVENNTDIPSFVLNTFSIKEIREKVPAAVVNLDLTLNRYATASGKRLFIAPNLMNKNTYIPEKTEDRKTDVVRKTNWVDLDTIRFSIPENLYPEFLPEPVKINSKFGEYQANFQFDAGKVTYIRRMKVWKGRYAKETYNELVDFYKNVSKADNIKLVFLNKT
jgi:hypothetical protein